MGNSRKQSHHFEFSFLLMGWVIGERQCGSKAKEPAGIQRAGLNLPQQPRCPRAGSVLPLELKGSPCIQGSVPQNYLPGLISQGCRMCLCRLRAARGCQLKEQVGAKCSPCLKEGALFYNFCEGAIRARGGRVWMKQRDRDRAQSSAHWMGTFTQHSYWTSAMCQALF